MDAFLDILMELPLQIICVINFLLILDGAQNLSLLLLDIKVNINEYIMDRDNDGGYSSYHLGVKNVLCVEIMINTLCRT